MARQPADGLAGGGVRGDEDVFSSLEVQQRALLGVPDGAVDSGVAIVSERAFLKPAKTKEDEEAERTEDKKKSITPARQIIDGKAIVKLSGTTNFDEKEHDDVLGKKKTLAGKSSSKLETV